MHAYVCDRTSGGPWKSMAPKSMPPTGIYSTKSDVYMFGMFMWEVTPRKEGKRETRQREGEKGECIVRVFPSRACSVE